MIQVSDLVKGICCVCGAFLIQFSLGTIYTFGNMNPYIASYLRYRTSNSWVNSGHMVWIFAIAVFSQALTMSLGGLLEKKVGARITCLVGSWMMSLGTIFTYFAIKLNLVTVILTYGLVFGMGTGMTYSVALAVPMKWFPQRKGLVTGTVVAGYGLGSLIFNLVQTKLINPNNISPNATSTEERYFTDSSVLDNIPFCFIVIGSTYAAMQLLGVVLLIDPSRKQHSSGEVWMPVVNSKSHIVVEKMLVEKVDGEEEEYSKNKAYSTELNELDPSVSHEFGVKEAIKDRRFWILWSSFFFNGIVIIVISTFYKSFGQTFISNDRYFSTVGAVAAIFNSGGRLIWGRLLDLVSYRKMMTTLTILMAVVIGSFYACSTVTSPTGKEAMYFIWVCLLFFCLSGSFAMFPTVTSQTFGNTNMAIIYGLLFYAYAVSSITGALLFSSLLPLISFGGVFIIATISALLSLVATQFFPNPVIKEPPQKTAD